MDLHEFLIHVFTADGRENRAPLYLERWQHRRLPSAAALAEAERMQLEKRLMRLRLEYDVLTDKRQKPGPDLRRDMLGIEDRLRALGGAEPAAVSSERPAQ